MMLLLLSLEVLLVRSVPAAVGAAHESFPFGEAYSAALCVVSVLQRHTIGMPGIYIKYFSPQKWVFLCVVVGFRCFFMF